ncbi:MAG: GNAT family N-acetyltransferase [Nannocystaceae bacterium]
MRGLRTATEDDLDFVALADRSADDPASPLDAAELRAHRPKIRPYVVDADKITLVEEVDGALVGAILARFRDLDAEDESPANRLLVDRVLPELDPRWMPADRRFTEIFNLWVAPEHRRRGVATRLKRALEAESLRRGVTLLYTHTDQDHADVLALNQRLGYVVVRRGPIWDDVVRVSLVKRLDRPG